MAIRSKIEVSVQSRDNRNLPPTQATLIKVEWNHSERIKNAIRIFGIVITFTFISIFIPILHFVLVPSLLITSFVLAMNKMSEKVRSEGGTGECPKCNQTFHIQPSAWTKRITHSCDHCPEELEMLLAEK